MGESPSSRFGMGQLGPDRRKRIWRALLRKYGPVCQLCFTKIDMELKHPDPKSKSVGHIIAVADSGSNLIENLQPEHLRCNAWSAVKRNQTITPKGRYKK